MAPSSEKQSEDTARTSAPKVRRLKIGAIRVGTLVSDGYPERGLLSEIRIVTVSGKEVLTIQIPKAVAQELAAECTELDLAGCYVTEPDPAEEVMADQACQNQKQAVAPELVATGAPSPSDSEAADQSERPEPTSLFELAWTTFERDRQELLKTHYGQWVLYHGDHRYGPFKKVERLEKLAVEKNIPIDDRVLRRIDNYDPFDVTIAF